MTQLVATLPEEQEIHSRGSEAFAQSWDDAFWTLEQHESRLFRGASTAQVSLKAGEWLVRRGETCKAVHVLVQGWAIRSLSTAKGKRQITAILLPGDVCDLGDVLSQNANEDVQMLTDGHAMSQPAKIARWLLRNDRDTATECLRLLQQDQCALSHTVLRLGRQVARERTAYLLCDLSHRLGGASFELPLTQDQLGDVLGLTSIHVCRILGELRGDGLIRSRGRIMTILNIDELRRIGDFAPSRYTVSSIGRSPAGEQDDRLADAA